MGYGAGAMAWQTDVATTQGAGSFLWGARYEGPVLLTPQGDVHWDLLMLRQA